MMPPLIHEVAVDDFEDDRRGCSGRSGSGSFRVGKATETGPKSVRLHSESNGKSFRGQSPIRRALLLMDPPIRPPYAITGGWHPVERHLLKDIFTDKNATDIVEIHGEVALDETPPFPQGK